MKTATPNKPMKQHLFYETSHSPSLVELVGYEEAKNIVDFCFIANPYYPTPDMLKHLQEYLPTLIKSYPSSNSARSQKHLADVLHVNPENLVIGNGATELITILSETILESIGIPVPTFSEYLEKLKDRRSAELYFLKKESDYQIDLHDYLRWIEKNMLRAALVINPANPTGQTFSLDDMQNFLVKAKKLDLVIVDESFIDFAGDPIPSLLTCADKYSNLLIVRSMSKHCGIPGLRLGYCYTENRYILNHLRRAIPTWNINTLAEYFLSLLPPTDAEYHEARKKLIADVKWFYEQLKDIPGFKVYPTGANFVLIRIDCGLTAAELQLKLLEEYRLYVRDCSNKVGMDNAHIRAASQGRDKDALLVDALKKISTTCSKQPPLF